MSLTPVNNQSSIPIDPGNTDASRDAKLKHLRKVCADFESIFIEKMLSSMRNTVDDSSLFGKGLGSDIYQGMFDTEMAKEMAGSGGMGIGDLLYRELVEKIGNETGSEETDAKKPVSLQGIIKSGFKEISELPVFDRIQSFDPIIQQASEKYNVPKNLIYAVITQESAGNPTVVSHAGAKGLMQLMDGTASEMGVKNAFNPKQNIEGGVRYLRTQLDEFNDDVELALAAYNAGPNNVKRYNGVPPFKETQEYIKKVQQYADKYSERLQNS